MMKPVVNGAVSRETNMVRTVAMKFGLAGALVAATMALAAPVGASPVRPAQLRPASATLTPGQLTVGLSLPSEGFETGVARGAHVIYAQGFDIDLALALAKGLGLPKVTFVQSGFGDLIAAGKKPWDIAVAQITITPARSQDVAFSQPYMTVDQGVLAAKNLTGEHYGIALPKGSPLVPRVNAALGALIANGTVQRLETKWFAADLAKVPVLH